MNYIASPAYGRDYKSGADVMEAFVKGLDFVNELPHIRGKYMSVRDVKPGDSIELRYNKQQKVIVAHVDEVTKNLTF